MNNLNILYFIGDFCIRNSYFLVDFILIVVVNFMWTALQQINIFIVVVRIISVHSALWEGGKRPIFLLVNQKTYSQACFKGIQHSLDPTLKISWKCDISLIYMYTWNFKKWKEKYTFMTYSLIYLRFKIWGFVGKMMNLQF